MGYLTDNIPLGQSAADCPDIYPFSLVVEWVNNDRFGGQRPVTLVAQQIQETLPDVEDWQLSVWRSSENRAKWRFRDQATRDQAQARIAGHSFFSLTIRQLVPINPPDYARRGIA